MAGFLFGGGLTFFGRLRRRRACPYRGSPNHQVKKAGVPSPKIEFSSQKGAPQSWGLPPSPFCYCPYDPTDHHLAANLPKLKEFKIQGPPMTSKTPQGFFKDRSLPTVQVENVMKMVKNGQKGVHFFPGLRPD